MKELTIREYPLSIKLTDDQGESETRTAIIQEVLSGVSNLFFLDIQTWLEAHVKEEWKKLPVFVLYHGGMQFPSRFPLFTRSYTKVTLINLDCGEG